MDGTTAGIADIEATVKKCHKMMRFATGVILAAFVLIIGVTTFSTGPVVQVVGKGLYYVILLSILLSLGVWYYRSKREKLLPADLQE